MTMNSEFLADVQQMYLSGVNVRRIAELLECDLFEVYRAMETLNLTDIEVDDSFDPWNTINS